jgi:hypothetical protein
VFWSCVITELPPPAAKFSFKTHVFFMILLRKIMKNTWVLNFNLGLCKKVFAACGGEIFFGWRHLFPDFASQNQEKDVSIQI